MYRPRVFRRTQQWMVANGKPFDAQVMFLVARLLFRGIYFPQMTALAWLRLLASNSMTIARLVGRRLLTTPRPRPGAGVTGEAPAVPAAALEDPTSATL